MAGGAFVTAGLVVPVATAVGIGLILALPPALQKMSGNTITWEQAQFYGMLISMAVTAKTAKLKPAMALNSKLSILNWGPKTIQRLAPVIKKLIPSKKPANTMYAKHNSLANKPERLLTYNPSKAKNSAKLLTNVHKRYLMTERLLKKSKSVYNLIARSADDVNAELFQKHVNLGFDPKKFVSPYTSGNVVYEFNIKDANIFHKSFDGTTEGFYRPWLSKGKLIKHPKKYYDGVATPSDHPYKIEAEVMEGSRMRMGIAAEVPPNAFKQGMPPRYRTGGRVQSEVVVDDYSELENILKPSKSKELIIK